jgi:mannose-6-phosphate isomerase-like protein (cupin superfamily)
MSNVTKLSDKFNLFQVPWHPKIVGELNDSYVKLAKLKGEFVWHHHDNEDELFLVIKGALLIKLCDQELAIHVGKVEFDFLQKQHTIEVT